MFDHRKTRVLGGIVVVLVAARFEADVHFGQRTFDAVEAVETVARLQGVVGFTAGRAQRLLVAIKAEANEIVAVNPTVGEYVGAGQVIYNCYDELLAERQERLCV